MAEELDCTALSFAPVELKQLEAMTLPHCSLAWLSIHVLSGHLAAAHGMANLIKKRAAGSLCFACLKHFVTRNELVHHLRSQSAFWST